MKAERTLVGFLHSVTLLLAGSAAVIVFIVMPYVFFEHWHLLPDWQSLQLMYLTFPVIIAWNYAGFVFLVIVVAGEVLVSDLKSASRRTKIEATVKISVCLLAYLFLTIGNQVNLH